MRSSVLLSLFFASAVVAAEPISWDINAEVSGVANSEFRRSDNVGQVSSFDFEVHAIGSAQVKPAFLLRFGFEFQRFDFQVPDAAPLPNNLESLNALLGADLQFGDAWLFRIDFHPGFYSGDNHIEGHDFNMPVTLGGSYFVNADLQLVAGLSVDLERKYAVLPAAGVRWKFARQWVLNGILPRPRLEYLLNEKSTIYVGGDFRLSTFRVNGDFGDAHGLSKLNNAYVDNTQIRVGAGISSKVFSVFTLEAEAGCVTLDDFDYHRADIGVRAQDTPFYGRIGLQAQF